MEQLQYNEIHFIVNLICNILCLVFGVLLLDMHSYKIFITRFPSVYPSRYVLSRKGLGIAYLLLGLMALLQNTGVMPTAAEGKLVFGEIAIYSLQAQLFTTALLGLYNSRYITLKRIIWNTLPVSLSTVIYFILWKSPNAQNVLSKMFLVYYAAQLIVYTFIFIAERKKFLEAIGWYYGDGPRFTIYRMKGVRWLFAGNIILGILAILSMIISNYSFSLFFVIVYTIYCVVTGWYFINSAWRSQKIQDITTPEEWKKTESVARNL